MRLTLNLYDEYTITGLYNKREATMGFDDPNESFEVTSIKDINGLRLSMDEEVLDSLMDDILEAAREEAFLIDETTEILEDEDSNNDSNNKDNYPLEDDLQEWTEEEWGERN
jgi:hypothetical protein